MYHDISYLWIFDVDTPSYGPYASSAQAGQSLARESSFSIRLSSELVYKRQFHGNDIVSRNITYGRNYDIQMGNNNMGYAGCGTGSSSMGE
jgi:hypothetical protein